MVESNLLKKICKKVEGAAIVEAADSNLGFVDSGSLALNKIISGKFNGGYPIGSLIEISGESSTAKTVFIIHALISAQKDGYYSVFVDNEQALSFDFAESLGLDLTKLIYLSPESMEDCFAAIDNTIKAIREADKDTPIVVGYDSIGSSPTAKELDGGMGENAEISGALRAKIAGQCLRKLNMSVRPSKATIIVVNQLRGTLNMYGPSNSKAGGGRALKYYCGVQAISKSTKRDIIFDDLKNAIGINGTIFIEKNKHTVPFQECGFTFYFKDGLDRYAGLEQILKKARKITTPINPETGKESKGWYVAPGFQEEKFRLKELPEILDKFPGLLDE